MRFAAFNRVTACIVGISCSFAPMTSGAQSCKCPKNPGPGGGVQCAKNQIATCDPSSGECNCACDSVQAGKTRADYQAQILSNVLHTKVDPAELSSPQYNKFMSSFRESTEDKGTFSFGKESGAGRGRQVKVGVPEWLEEVLVGKGGVSIGPGASLQNCPNGICIGGENIGTATVNNFAPPRRMLTKEKYQDFVEELSKEKGEITVVLAGSSDDVYPLAKQLCEAAKQAKWSYACPKGRNSVLGEAEVEGLECYAEDWDSKDASVFKQAMKAAELPCRFVPHQWTPRLGGPTMITGYDFNGGMPSARAITILIGRPPR